MTDDVMDILGLETPSAEPAPVEPEPVAITEPESTIVESEPEPVAGTDPITEPIEDLLDSIMKRVAPADKTSPWLRVLLYGPPGVRKTTFAALAPGAFIYETDTGGCESLLNFPETANVPVLPFRSTTQILGMPGDPGLLDAMINDDPRLSKMQTFVIDTYTGYANKDLAEIPRLGDGRPNYLTNTEHMKDLTDKLRQIKKHLILIAHVKEEKDETTGVVLRRPDLTPKVAQAVIAMMGVIGYMTLDGDNWQLQLQPSPGVAAKCRIGGLPATLSNPNFQHLIDARNNSIQNNKGNN